MNTFMEKAKEIAERGAMQGEGGPFGAVIVNEKDEIISEGNNKVISEKDPTAHAEIVAIRRACQKLGTHDLSGMTIYSSCEPCPMCLSAIIWANIRKIKYACTREDAAEIGFRDEAIYEYLKGKNKDLLELEQIDREYCKYLFEDYKKNNKTIY